MTGCVSCTPPEHEPGLVMTTGSWKILLHPDQTVPGALLAVAQRHVPKVSQLTDAEAADFFGVYRLVERALEGTLGATMVNLSCLRNWAFRATDPDPPWANGRPDPHVHWHVAPRFERPVTIGQESFVDVDFGNQLVWRGRQVDEVTRRLLIDALRPALAVTDGV
ncbi:MAG TPA: HIT family protein [Ilumatobacter sp.]|nr:HIT family protein [Ilumatobacter sp.]